MSTTRGDRKRSWGEPLLPVATPGSSRPSSDSRHRRAPNEQGQSRKWIYQSLDVSLKRLGTDYIDIFYFHRAIVDAPMEEGLRAIGDLIRQGKVRYYGVSNFKGWRIAEVVRIADQLGIDRPVASEPLYNIVDRTAEVEQLPAAAHYGIGIVLTARSHGGY